MPCYSSSQICNFVLAIGHWGVGIGPPPLTVPKPSVAKPSVFLFAQLVKLLNSKYLFFRESQIYIGYIFYV